MSLSSGRDPHGKCKICQLHERAWAETQTGFGRTSKSGGNLSRDWSDIRDQGANVDVDKECEVAALSEQHKTDTCRYTTVPVAENFLEIIIMPC